MSMNRTCPISNFDLFFDCLWPFRKKLNYSKLIVWSATAGVEQKSEMVRKNGCEKRSHEPFGWLRTSEALRLANARSGPSRMAQIL